MLVVVDGVFSMEGDVAPLPQIVELCRAHGARLMVDEAHGAGVLGARGAGTAELFGVEDGVDLRMGTFSKSLASCGGFIAGSHEVIDFLRIQSRAFLFTAAAVPAAVGAALAALRVIRSDGRAAAVRARARERRVPQPRAARARLPRRRAAAAARRLDGRRRRSSRWSSATTGRPSCCGARSTTPASSSTSRCTRRCRPAGALLRTSVMATHDRADARPRAGALRDRQGGVRGRARSAARPDVPDCPSSGVSTIPLWRVVSERPCPFVHKPQSCTNHPLFANDPVASALIIARGGWLACGSGRALRRLREARGREQHCRGIRQEEAGGGAVGPALPAAGSNTNHDHARRGCGQRGGSMDATATAPAPQHMRALAQANRVRLARAELKRQVAEGRRPSARSCSSAPGRPRAWRSPICC